MLVGCRARVRDGEGQARPQQSRRAAAWRRREAPSPENPDAAQDGGGPPPGLTREQRVEGRLLGQHRPRYRVIPPPRLSLAGRSGAAVGGAREPGEAAAGRHRSQGGRDPRGGIVAPAGPVVSEWLLARLQPVVSAARQKATVEEHEQAFSEAHNACMKCYAATSAPRRPSPGRKARHPPIGVVALHDLQFHQALPHPLCCWVPVWRPSEAAPVRVRCLRCRQVCGPTTDRVWGHMPGPRHPSTAPTDPNPCMPDPSLCGSCRYGLSPPRHAACRHAVPGGRSMPLGKKQTPLDAVTDTFTLPTAHGFNGSGHGPRGGRCGRGLRGRRAVPVCCRPCAILQRPVSRSDRQWGRGWLRTRWVLTGGAAAAGSGRRLLQPTPAALSAWRRSQDAKELLRGWRRMFPEAKAFQVQPPPQARGRRRRRRLSRATSVAWCLTRQQDTVALPQSSSPYLSTPCASRASSSSLCLRSK